MLLDVIIVVVDDGPQTAMSVLDSTIPLPNYRKESTHFEAAVALLVDGLEGRTSDYNPKILDSIGVTIVGDHEREGAGWPH